MGIPPKNLSAPYRVHRYARKKCILSLEKKCILLHFLWIEVDDALEITEMTEA